MLKHSKSPLLLKLTQNSGFLPIFPSSSYHLLQDPVSFFQDNTGGLLKILFLSHKLDS